MQQHWTLPNKWGFPTDETVLLFVSELCVFFPLELNSESSPSTLHHFPICLAPCLNIVLLFTVFIFTSGFPPNSASDSLLCSSLLFLCFLGLPQWPFPFSLLTFLLYSVPFAPQLPRPPSVSDSFLSKPWTSPPQECPRLLVPFPAPFS